MDAIQATEFVKGLTSNDILRVYSGRPGCACGCRGKYHDTGAQVTRVLRTVQTATGNLDFAPNLDQTRNLDDFWAVSDQLNWITVQTPTRVYTVYLTAEVARRTRTSA